MSWAAATGLRVPEFRRAALEEFETLPDYIPKSEGDAFLIDRFDRAPGAQRVHIEDFGQVLDQPPGDPQYKGRYEHIGTVLAALCPQDLREFIERLAFCAVCGNTDAHLKNWSLIYPDKRTPRLSPAYDLVASVLSTRHESMTSSRSSWRAAGASRTSARSPSGRWLRHASSPSTRFATGPARGRCGQGGRSRSTRRSGPSLTRSVDASSTTKRVCLWAAPPRVGSASAAAPGPPPDAVQRRGRKQAWFALNGARRSPSTCRTLSDLRNRWSSQRRASVRGWEAPQRKSS